MVGEFPELQGVMGGYYARAEGRAALLSGAPGLWTEAGGGEGVEAVADAIRDHYRPQGPADALPQGRLGRVLALADKLDLLISFFSIGEKPTGSRDPFALRRAALGVVRILLEAGAGEDLDALLAIVAAAGPNDGSAPRRAGAVPEVRTFILERFKGLLREEGGRHDVLDAVFATGVGDLAGALARSKALGAFIASDAGASLLAGYRRASNILKAEARKDDGASTAAPLAGEASAPPPQEAALGQALAAAETALEAALARGAHEDALAILAGLRGPVDAFFEKVLVNDSDPEIRRRRLRLLTGVRDTANRVADLSLLAG
jgi:glycyl-tRNA synthetase beta chain